MRVAVQQATAVGQINPLGSDDSPRWDQQQTWYVEPCPVISLLTQPRLTYRAFDPEKKPRSDGSRVYFGYEGKALSVSSPGLLLEDQRSF